MVLLLTLLRDDERGWLRESDAQDTAQLLREAHSATVSRGDQILRRLQRYRSFGSWGDIWTGVDGSRS